MTRSYLENHVWDTPEQCIATLRCIADQFHPEEFMLVMRFGSMPQDASDNSIELFAREVLPAIREFKTLDPINYQKSRVSTKLQDISRVDETWRKNSKRDSSSSRKVRVAEGACDLQRRRKTR